MITIITAVLVGVATYFGVHNGLDCGTGWSITSGILGLIAAQVVLGRIIQKKVKRDMDVVQLILTEGQKRIQAKMQRWQMRPPSSIQAAQKEIADDTRVFVKEAIKATEALKKYRFIVPFIERQMASAQFQLNWMIKDFKKVDELIDKVFFIDPTMSAMRMARMYMKDVSTDEIRKVYTKATRRLRYNQNVLLAATMSWIEVERKEFDAAFKTLTAALKTSDDETLKRNHAELMNNRTAHFSNSSLGDSWYALLLEEPKVRAQRQQRVYR